MGANALIKLICYLHKFLFSFPFSTHAETPKRRGQLRSGIYHRKPDFDADRQTLHHESRPERVLGILLRQPGIHRRRLKKPQTRGNTPTVAADDHGNTNNCRKLTAELRQLHCDIHPTIFMNTNQLPIIDPLPFIN